MHKDRRNSSVCLFVSSALIFPTSAKIVSSAPIRKLGICISGVAFILVLCASVWARHRSGRVIPIDKPSALDDSASRNPRAEPHLSGGSV